MPQLSIIIPAFNESRKISQDILAAAEFLTSESINGEIIVVDDGSSDDTAGIAEKAIEPLQSTGIVVKLKQNQANL